jgi:hypothetical protein
MSFFYNCPVCESSSDKIPSNADSDNVNCPRCGRYFITGSAIEVFKNSKSSQRQIANLSGWIRENSEATITSLDLDTLLALKTPTVSDRARMLITAIAKSSKYIGDGVGISYKNSENRWLSISWSENNDELIYLVEKYLLQEQKWIVDAKIFSIGSDITVQLTPSGYAYLDQLRQDQGEGVQGFCAMWFDKTVTHIWVEAIAPAIADAGYRPVRIDEVNHNNRIDDEILAQIRRSRFVIADFTGSRGGVCFEAGFALGLGTQVIWTVREDELEDVHFDNRQYNFLQWSLADIPAFKKALQSRIEATLGIGPLVNL